MMDVLRSLGFVAALTLSGAAVAAPVVYNIDATVTGTFVLNANSPPTLGAGFTIQNNSVYSELFTVTPVRSGETPGALFTAAHRFGGTLNQWEWNYWLLIGNVADLGGIGISSYTAASQIGFGGGLTPSNGAGIGGVPSDFGAGTPAYQVTAIAAFNLAPTHSFILAPGQFARFYWRDNNFDDNTGGISMSIDRQAIPTPPSLALSLMALALIGGVARLRAVRKS